jgi:RNA polymerase sigma-70 factor (ECF subfamily)
VNAGSEQPTSGSFDQMALPHLDAVYGMAVRLTRNSDTARDLVQETFLRAFANWPSFRHGTSCRAWLLRIGYRVFVDAYRRTRVLSIVAVGDEGEEGALARVPADAPGPEEVALRHLDAEALRRALDTLPDAFRDTIILVDLQQLSCSEAAQAMKVPRGTVLSRLSRGRAHLRQALLSGLRPLGDDE